VRTIPFELARSALDAAPDALIIVDERGNVAFANRQVSAIFGYPHDELIGRPIDVLIPERFHARHLLHRSAYSGAPHLRPMGAGLDLYARRRDGSEFPVEISLSPIRGPGHELVAAAIRDVTDRRRVQAELIEARDAAQRAIKPRAGFSPPPATICASRCRRWHCSTVPCAAW